MAVEPITAVVTTAFASEAGKAAGKSAYDKVGKALSHAVSIPVDKAIANGSAFTNYLQNACASISHAKTILYHQPTSIESFFEPMTIVVKKGCSRSRVSTKKVEDVLKLGSRLIIAGHAGAGKSIMMRHLFIDAYNRGQFLPVYVELRAINQAPEGTSIIDLLYQSLHKYTVEFGQDDFVRNLDAQDFLFLLDGLDEVSESRMSVLRNTIDSLGKEHPRARIIMSSRWSEDEFRSWEGFVVADTSRLSKDQAISLVNRLDFDLDAKELFVNELDARLYEKHESFASNPLLLTMMLMVFSERAAIPDDLTEFYSQTFDTLFRRHDASKSGKYHRELKCGLSDVDFRRIFSNFCFITFIKDEFEFKYEILLNRIGLAIKRIMEENSKIDDRAYFRDLLESICMLQHDGNQYKFVHRSFQEYFAAVYTIDLPSDKDLKDVVVQWLDEHGPICDEGSSVYFDALQKLNPGRFERQVVFEVLRELRDICLQSEKPCFKYLETLYASILFYDDDLMHDRFGFSCRSSVYCTLTDLLRKSNDIAWKDWVSDSIDSGSLRKTICRYLQSLSVRSLSLHEADFSEVKEAGLVDMLLGATDMGASRVFAIIDQMEASYTKRDKGSILDDLYSL